MLSEKAKGKQRAVDPPDVDGGDEQSCSSQTEHELPRNLIVRFTEGAPDLTISVCKQDSVRDVKRRIRDVRPEFHGRRLRLIHSGRLLANDISLYSWLASLEIQKRASIEDKDAGSSDVSAPAATWIHCSVGQPMTPDDQEDDDHSQTTQIQPIRGFDRLASVGFSQQDIESFRRQFHVSQWSANLDQDFATEEEYDEHTRSLEEQWMDSLADSESAPLFLSSSFPNPSVLEGLLVGFFFPFLPFFFLRRQKRAVFWEDDSDDQELAPSVVFSPRMSMGLVVGFLANILFGMWRYLLESS